MAALWFQEPVIGATLALAIVVNIITAALFGVLIPIILDKFRLDPALAGSVILTTVTDVVGFCLPRHFQFGDVVAAIKP